MDVSDKIWEKENQFHFWLIHLKFFSFCALQFSLRPVARLKVCSRIRAWVLVAYLKKKPSLLINHDMKIQSSGLVSDTNSVEANSCHISLHTDRFNHPPTPPPPRSTPPVITTAGSAMLHGTQSQPHTQPCFHVKSSLGTDLGRAPLLLHLDSNTWKSVVLTLSVFLFVCLFCCVWMMVFLFHGR